MIFNKEDIKKKHVQEKQQVFYTMGEKRESIVGYLKDVHKVSKGLPCYPTIFKLLYQMAADYFEVVKPTIDSLIEDNRPELESDGLKVLEGEELALFKSTRHLLKGKTNLIHPS
jgi:hypothetical protein